MREHTQTVLAEREDGHSREGIAGNCFQTAVACLLDLEIEEVPHFAIYTDWWAAARRWARGRGGDFTWFPVPVPKQYANAWQTCVDWGWEHNSKVLLSGPSPRGPFHHVVVGNVDLETLHDPHPSRQGLESVEEVILYCEPYDPAPFTRELLPKREF